MHDYTLLEQRLEQNRICSAVVDWKQKRVCANDDVYDHLIYSCSRRTKLKKKRSWNISWKHKGLHIEALFELFLKD